jgi:hypothetical protein
MRIASGLVLAALVSGTAAFAYTLEQAAQPAEYPPSSFRGDVYVDSRGCAYARGSVGGTASWVPRISSDRKSVVCGLTPTANVTSVATRPPPPPAPPPPAEMAAPAAMPTVAAAPLPVATTPAPALAAEIRTVAVTCPVDGSTARVRIGGGTVGVRCPAGRTTAQSFIIRSANGDRTRLIARPAAPVATAASPTLSGGVGDVVADGRVYIGRPGNAGGLTASGYAFGNGFGFTDYPGPVDPVPGAATGTVVRIAAPTAITITPPVVPAVPQTVIPEGYRAAWSDDRLNPHRGPRTAYGDAQMAATMTVDTVPMRSINPAPARGLIAGTARAPVYSTKSNATPAAASGYRYVQVGTFNVPSNATNAAAVLRNLGLPGRVAETASGKTVVIAGPFDRVAELNDALSKARRAFPDAFLRN